MFLKYLFFFFLFHVALAQESIYYGKVLFDEQPLEGVSVLLKGTSKGTITNKEGIFKINIGKLENQKLVFSFVGYEPILININKIVGTSLIILKNFADFVLVEFLRLARHLPK